MTADCVIHQLDLTAYLPGDRLGPADETLALTVRAIDELTGSPVRPSAWDLATYVLKGTGRLRLDAAERDFLGERAGQFPVLG